MKISAKEFSQRRRRLLDMMTEGSLAVIPGARLRLRNRDVDYLFRQDSDFYYLTGFSEPDALLVLAPGREHGEVILFCRDRDPVFEQWDGERVGPDRAAQLLGVDDAFPNTDVGEILPGMLEGRDRIYANLGDYPDFDQQLLRWVKGIRRREASGAIPPGEFVDLRHLLHELRLYKSAGELGVMREACAITASAHVRAMQQCRPGMTEGQLEAELIYEFMRRGARTPAYPCIVGGGNNACVLHYVANDDSLKKNDVVLIDAGCEYEHYAADVTRSFPVSGRFNRTQQALYEVVLEANAQAIAACAPGTPFSAPHDTSIRVIVDGLIDLGLLDGDPAEIIETERYRAFCPHKTSHWLGMDVHDVGDYRVQDTWRELEPGMVLTIEPGIYIPDSEHNAHIPARWRGLGIRIEDDVLITKQGPEVLSAAAPKAVDDIHAVMAAE